MLMHETEITRELSTLSERYQAVRARVDAACRRVGRDPKEVTLLAVSKTKPVSMLQEVYGAGARAFGENKVQEILEKIPGLPEDIRWHMIGHLQTNKVRQIVGKVCLIHSVDSLKLAREIEKESERSGIRSDVLLEINVAREESKFGFFLEDAEAAIREIASFPHIRICGLMTIAPFVECGEKNREFFRKLNQFYVDIANKNIDNVSMNILSMGMTGDYEVAIEEGSTLVRVGTGIFGER